MGVLSDNAIIGASAAGGYDIENSCRFEDGDTPFLYRTFGTPTNNKKWTLSLWFKRSNITQGQILSAAGNQLFFLNMIYFSYAGSTGNDTTTRMKTHQVFRDPAAWYHLVFTMDTTQAGFSDQQKLYINGERVDDMSSTAAVTQNIDTAINSAIYHSIGRYSGGGEYFDGYMADYYFIDGQVLTPASFGETDVLTNQWKAKKYAGTYGNNGFFLEFQNSAALGTDTSGNGNNFTSSGLTATAQMIDTPQNSIGGNFATMNSVTKPSVAQTFSEGNLKIVPDSNWEFGSGTFQMVSGKWYWELRAKASSVKYGILVDYAKLSSNQELGIQYYPGNKIVDGTWSSYGATYGDGDIIGYACDMDGSTITFYKNGVSQGAIAFSGALTTAPAAIFGGGLHGTSGGANFNFGADSSFAGEETAQNNTDDNDCGDFYYAPPAGYLALCSNNLPDPAIALPTEHRDTLLWTGAASNPGAARTISGLGFEPEFFFQACRAGGGGGARLTYDVLRGFGNDKELCLDSPKAEGAENADEYGYVSAVTSDGITYSPGSLGYSNNVVYYDISGATFVSWVWKAGGTPTATNSAGAGNVPTAGSAKVNGSNSSAAASGSIPLLKQSANTTSGFSMTTFTGTGATATLGHGLSQRPDAFVVKNLNVTAGGGYDWLGWTVGLPGAGYILNWNTNGSSTADSTIFTTTNPPCDNSVIHLGNHAYVNSSGSTNILYAWHSVEGYSKIGFYEGNTSTDGPFIWTGFRPSFVWIKCIDTGYAWFLNDNKRDPYNVVDENIATEATSGATTELDKDFVSNGFKIRTSAGGNNDDNTTYWYMAFAESPFKTSNAR